jgi:hypothetical protein
MAPAIDLYRAFGFEEIPPYWHNSVPVILYFGEHLWPLTARLGAHGCVAINAAAILLYRPSS